MEEAGGHGGGVQTAVPALLSHLSEGPGQPAPLWSRPVLDAPLPVALHLGASAGHEQGRRWQQQSRGQEADRGFPSSAALPSSPSYGLILSRSTCFS